MQLRVVTQAEGATGLNAMRRRGLEPSEFVRRTASRPRPRRWILGLALPVLLIACAQRGASTAWKIEPTFVPAPPRTGPTQLVLDIRDPAGTSLRGARVKIEANMNHAGMVPVLIEAREQEPGRYAAQFEFCMAGDWYLLLDIEPPLGPRTSHTIPLPGVILAEGDG